MSRRKRNKPAADAGAPSGERTRAILYTICAVIAAAGLANATYLTASHVAGETVTCLASARCSEVLASKYASIAGVPLAAIGAVGYFITFSTATLAAFGRETARRVLTLTIGAMFIGTLWLLYLQAFVIKAFCDYCLLSAAMIFALAGIVIVTPPRK
ncbi:MAG TPA: vitamin K epoxide reductase family protein [Chthoniobacterales bacterium]|nr:vitamin K epoxide reductase family protein [Chthoniobacterales bacterium]